MPEFRGGSGSLLPDTWNHGALRKVCFLSEMVFGCHSEQEEVLYGIIHFHEKSFELCGLPVGPVSAFGAREFCLRAHGPTIQLKETLLGWATTKVKES